MGIRSVSVGFWQPVATSRKHEFATNGIGASEGGVGNLLKSRYSTPPRAQSLGVSGGSSLTGSAVASLAAAPPAPIQGGQRPGLQRLIPSVRGPVAKRAARGQNNKNPPNPLPLVHLFCTPTSDTFYTHVCKSLYPRLEIFIPTSGYCPHMQDEFEIWPNRDIGKVGRQP